MALVDRRDNPKGIPEGLGGGRLTTGTGMEEWLKIVQEQLTATFPEPPIEYPGSKWTLPRVPLGRREPLDLGNVLKVPSVPTVVKPAGRTTKAPSPGASPGKNQAPNKAELQVSVKPAREFMPPPVGPRVFLPTTPTKGESMDLGQLAGKGIDAYLQYKLATRAPAVSAPVQAQPAFVGGLFGGDESVTDSVVESIFSKPKRRRRRRRLATLSDIRDLAALKSVLGNGEAFKTWIATHPS